MTILDRRRQLQQQIAQLPDDQLTQVEQYLGISWFSENSFISIRSDQITFHWSFDSGIFRASTHSAGFSSGA